MTEKKIILKKGKDEFVNRFHCWIFSGAIKAQIGKPVSGDYVEVFSDEGVFLCSGHFSQGSIAVRIINRKEGLSEEEALKTHLIEAITVRKGLGFFNNEDTNCFRLIHGEGDNLPGLIVDVYASTLVIQTHSEGMYRNSAFIADTLLADWPIQIDRIFLKPKTFKGDTEKEAAYYHGEALSGDLVKENGNSFFVDWESGQKTGFFLDQRDNRALVGKLSEGKSVLNAFCYSGGFSIYTLEGGANLVHSVDASEKAIEWTDKNVALLGDKAVQNHQSHMADVMAFLKESQELYDMVILDPPAFAKHIRSKHKAVQGYKRLNIEGLKHVREGGYLFTFSCSQVIDKALFRNTIVAAALESKRQIRILKDLEQGTDHPVNIFHPEGAYLKGLFLQVGAYFE